MVVRVLREDDVDQGRDRRRCSLAHHPPPCRAAARSRRRCAAATILTSAGSTSSHLRVFKPQSGLTLGCDIRHASRLVYSKGLDLSDPEAATPIGVGCKVCERPSCPQRAFPNIGQRLAIDENERRFAPYPVK
ncbi:MAG TPA: short-chain fatty acyl-CoA regulator family protein [Methylosinus sp.]